MENKKIGCWTWFIILVIAGYIIGWVEKCSSTPESIPHSNNTDGYYDGQYSFRRGMEWGEITIEGQTWNAQGQMGYAQFGYSGTIIGNNLIVNRTVYGTNATGEVFAEFDGDNISSGGWTFQR